MEHSLYSIFVLVVLVKDCVYDIISIVVIYGDVMEKLWNLWHGCHKISDGCKNCYVYRGDESRGLDASVIYKTKSFDMPIQRNKKGDYKLPAGSFVYTCFSSDFLLEDADEWRGDAWAMIKERSDCKFLFITKRIDRFGKVKPADWGDGYDNVIICSTCENQKQYDYRMPIFNELKIKHKMLILEPLLEEVDVSKHLTEDIQQVVVGGESGPQARVCDYNWVLKIREACMARNITFVFKQTGTYFRRDGRIYKIERKFHHVQARKAGINFEGKYPSSFA